MPDLSNPKPNFAQSIVKLQAEGKSFDREICEREPIRTPGAIQPHGALVAYRIEDERIVLCSENISEFLATDPAETLGKYASEILPDAITLAIRTDMEQNLVSANNPACYATTLNLRLPSACWIHARGGLVFVELENVQIFGGISASGYSRTIERAVEEMRDTETLEQLDATVLRAVRKITGYERTLIYRFDEDWNGNTTAEDMQEGSYQPFLGLRFPASDIPRQARELYSENLLRIMTDRDATPVHVLQSADVSAPADLSGARLRAQSPVHLEYQRNINVNGAMSASVMKQGKLWGLIVGHHRQRLPVSPQAARGVVHLVQSYAMRLNDLEERASRRKRGEQQRIYSALLEQMAVRDDFVEALTSSPVGLPTLLDAGGAGIVRGVAIDCIGNFPPQTAILKLLAAIPLDGETGTLATDQSSIWLAEFGDHAKTASGVLVVPLRDEAGTRILWFRPGVAETVNWAGNPSKAMSESGTHPLPRRSFERWTEERSGRSVPWSLEDIEVATSLGFAIGEVILRHGRKISALNQRLFQAERTTAAQDVTEIALRTALQEKDTQLAQKDFLLREVDHRVRNSLALISSMLQLQARSTLDPNTRQQFVEASRRVVTVGQVHQRLYQTGELRALNFGEYLRALTADLSESAGPDSRKRLILETTDVTLNADIVMPLGLIVNELVTNAFKHGDRRDALLTVNVSFAQTGGDMRLIVEDDGTGLPENFSPKSGTGLGMRLVNGLITQLNAQLEFESGDDGTRFIVIVPKKPEHTTLPSSQA